MGRIRIFAGLFISWALAGCSGTGPEWQKSFDIPKNGWASNMMLNEHWVSKSDIPDPYLMLDITHTRDFGYQNIYLIGHIRAGENKVLLQDTFSIQLAAPNSGRWLGKSISNNNIQWSDTIRALSPIEQGDTLDFSIQQFSRDTLLPEISEVGIRIVRKIK